MNQAQRNYLISQLESIARTKAGNLATNDKVTQTIKKKLAKVHSDKNLTIDVAIKTGGGLLRQEILDKLLGKDSLYGIRISREDLTTSTIEFYNEEIQDLKEALKVRDQTLEHTRCTIYGQAEELVSQIMLGNDVPDDLAKLLQEFKDKDFNPAKG